MAQTLRCGPRVRGRVFDVYEAEVPATTEVGIIPGEFLPSREDDSDIFPVCSHPPLFVEANKAWAGSVDCMISTHLYLWKGQEGV